ncbi:TRAP transporter fused permease subunit [Nocardiopsis exhalans]|uniref:TRAP transporter fused permease subunit n=1 Tax=Nocardiopsis exhalans TaxID=163604 RepID=A0ABY5DF37_9ACTN|nr:TRAP transporter fused permease subunit [Nocardiopsis exhalans]USY21984.1 TRAP transporter fused permease subunit [Nocardiopsis exhalans]
MTSDHKSPGAPGGDTPDSGGTAVSEPGSAALKGIEEDLQALEKHDYTEDTGVEGTRTGLSSIWRWGVFFAALVLATFHLWTAFTGTLPPLQQRSFHLALGLGLVFLLYPTKHGPEGARGPFYGASMAFSGLLVSYLMVGAASGTNTAMYLYLPQWLFGVVAALVLGGAVGLVRARGVSEDTSRAQRGAGWTLLVGAALISLDMVTSESGGGFFFLPTLGLVLVLAATALSLGFLCFPRVFPEALWPLVRRWGLSLTGAAILIYMLSAGITGWNVVGPAALILILVQASRHVPLKVMGMPAFDIVLSALGVFAGMYMFVNYQEIARTVGIMNPTYVMVGTIGILLIMVAASRVLGAALVVLSGALLAFAYFGQAMPGFLRHRGSSVDQIITNLYVGTEGVFGTPLGISATFIFLFMIFAAMLQRTGMERFFTDLALGATGASVGGTAKVGIVTSAFSGTMTGSSVANTVSNGAFTIPMMKKSGYKPEYAGAVEAASSTGGQIMPPIMGAGAFIMIEFTGASYQQILTAAAIPAVMFFVSQYVVVHYDSKRMGIGGLPKEMLPNLRRLLLTRGYLLAPVIAIFALLSMGYSPMFSAMGAVLATVGINLVSQIVAMPWKVVEGRLRPRAFGEVVSSALRLSLPIIIAAVAASALVWVLDNVVTGLARGMTALVVSVGIALIGIVLVVAFRAWKETSDDRLNLHTLLDGMVGASRLAIPIIVACASAGIIAGVITTTDLGLKLSRGLLGIADSVTTALANLLTAIAVSPMLSWAGLGPEFGAEAVASMRVDLFLILFMSMLACLILGIGLPTTANYVITATLAAPAIVAVLQGEFDTRTLAMILSAHLFVYYFGVLADITPPVCLAAYAASGISGGDPIRTGFYAVRIAVAAFVMPFMFVFNPAILLQDVTLFTGSVAAVSGVIGAALVALGLVGYLDRPLQWYKRLALIAGGLLLVSESWHTNLFGLFLVVLVIGYERWKTKREGGPTFVPQVGSAAAVPGSVTEAAEPFAGKDAENGNRD